VDYANGVSFVNLEEPFRLDGGLQNDNASTKHTIYCEHLVDNICDMRHEIYEGPRLPVRTLEPDLMGIEQLTPCTC
jgi:hypothetical protein